VDESLLLPEQQSRHAEQKLGPILEQAERTGDPLLARAVYHRALDLGARGIIDRYSAGRPKKVAQDYQRYVEAQELMNQSKGFEGLVASALRDRDFAREA
jgi:hypothetical protein